ncbi:S-adenosylmethionine-dependent methyltransferase [Exophiala dermatitidis]|nr:S-adenosylmethionine-dependent methyltransferase [Exophiala dermatitidis]
MLSRHCPSNVIDYLGYAELKGRRLSPPSTIRLSDLSMDGGNADGTRPPRQHIRPKKKKPITNPLVKGIHAFCKKHDDLVQIIEEDSDSDTLLTGSPLRSLQRPFSLSCRDFPKRYTIYAPLVLLPANFSTHNPRWREFYNGLLSESEKADLFECIAEKGFAGSSPGLRAEDIRIAISAPIAAEEDDVGHEVEAEDQKLSETVGPDSAKLSSASSVGDLETTATRQEAIAVQKQQQPPRPARKQNVIRSPSGLVPVYGDWGPMLGPATSLQSCNSDRTRMTNQSNPTRRDFDEAFWTSVSQHRGITQCWAPLYTMFSRGNVSEKARILGLDTSPSTAESTPATKSASQSQIQCHFPGLTSAELGQPLSTIDVMDFYVGIGYFAFCYLARGVRRVWGWDINPWSIEGLRRGCEKNGWSCLVVQVDDDSGNLSLVEAEGSNSNPKSCGQPENVAREIAVRILQGDRTCTSTRDSSCRSKMRSTAQNQNPEIRCIAFLGDNKWSAKVMAEIGRELDVLRQDRLDSGVNLNVRHANLGLLPTSQGSWENAVRVLIKNDSNGKGAKDEESNESNDDKTRGGWLHVHENVDIREIEAMKEKVVLDLQSIVEQLSKCEQAAEEETATGSETTPLAWSVSCVHIHQVKTYAPGVMHCVFDIHIFPDSNENPNG